MTRINVKIKAGRETELNGLGRTSRTRPCTSWKKSWAVLTENDVLILAGGIYRQPAAGRAERLLAPA